MNRTGVFAIVIGVALLLVSLMLGFQTTTISIQGDTVACGSFFAGPSDQALNLGVQSIPVEGGLAKVDPVAACAPGLSSRNVLVWVVFGGGIVIAAAGALARRKNATTPPAIQRVPYGPPSAQSR